MSKRRVKLAVHGAVQGVGFRPFVYRLANELQLTGWVLNSSQGVVIEVEGMDGSVATFLRRLETEKPGHSVLQKIEAMSLPPVGYKEFTIRESSKAGGKTALILPDIATCDDCLQEILDPANRRFGYPFTNCTNCGPRFSIIEALPYDRRNTAMKKFAMCADCEREYRDPIDRRFHAEPNACPRCGPQLQLWDSLGETCAEKEKALIEAAAAIRAGKIVALKGLGGFQLIVDARDEDAVVSLRRRKHREEKPFAVMFPSLAVAKTICEVSELEEKLLLSSESPIVLLKRKADPAKSVAPENPNLGAMLPYTPLHHLLLRALNFPIVATSGNLSDEPICIDEHEALTHLGGIADFFLLHDRSIVRHMDDSIVRVMAGRKMILRRARGFAPLPIGFKAESGKQKAEIILAVGAHLKNAVALATGGEVFVSQHIGDLATEEAHAAFVRATEDLPRLYDSNPTIVAHDLHPDYLSTKFALQQPGRQVGVQHHWAHVAACMTENEIAPPLLGVSLDGTGYGLDGTIWGGEFLLGKSDGGFERIAHLRPFRLPGGEAAVREPRRSALGLLAEIADSPKLALGFSPQERRLLEQMLEKKLNAPLTSSAGRLFDAVAALIGLRGRSSFEGQVAMELEFAADPAVTAGYSFELRGERPIVIDWETSICELLGDLQAGTTPGTMAAKFHNLLVEMIVAVARKVGERRVVLSGGCFQNRLLTERAIERLRAENFQPFWHENIPPNDGGISLGQVAAIILANNSPNE